MKILGIATVVIIILLSLPTILHKKIPELNDTMLRERAISTNMLPIPKTYEALLEVVDNPDNRMSKEKIALGKELFFDTLLSQDKTISCASCHKLEAGGDDGITTAIGHKGQANPSHLNSPTVLNAALAKSQFWDGRAKDVEEQAGGPIQAPFEMHMTPQEVEQRLNDDSKYVSKFKALFPEHSSQTPM